MSDGLSSSVQKVQNALNTLGFSYQISRLPSSTRSSSQAAKAVGCQVGQIAKSLVFKGKSTHQPFLVIASGSNRVNEKKMEEFILESVEKANPDFVHQKTGFTIGGVPPVGHLEKIDTFIDEDLLKHEEIWAAGGSPNAIFKLAPSDLVKMTGGKVVCIK